MKTKNYLIAEFKLIIMGTSWFIGKKFKSKTADYDMKVAKNEHELKDFETNTAALNQNAAILIKQIEELGKRFK